MFRFWLRQLVRQLFGPARRRRRSRPKPPRRPRMEALELRTLPATITWANPAGGSWQTAANWSPAQVPVNGDTVVIPDLNNPGADLTITYNGGTTTLASLTAGENLTVSGGTLVFTGGVTENGALTLSGTALQFNGSQTLGGTGSARLTGGGQIVMGTSGTALTVGSGFTIHGDSGTIANVQFIGGTTLLNQGTIAADASGGGLTISTNSFTNAAGGNVSVTNTGATLNLGSNVSAWSNAGTITLTAGALNLGGSFSTAGIGTLNRPNGTAGTVTLTGTLNNGGSDLLLTQFSNPTAGGLGTWNFLTGTIIGGTVTTSGGAILHAINNGVGPIDTLNGVTLDAGSTLQVDGGNTLVVTNTVGATYALTINGTVLLAGGGVLRANSNQTLGGAGQVTTSGGGQIMIGASSTTLTLAPGLTVRGDNLALTNVQFISGTSLVNQGTIAADVAGSVTISTNGFTNAAGANVSVANAGATLNLGSNVSAWSNAGTITLTAGALTLGGSFSTAGIGTLNRPNGTAGTVTLTGTLNNGGSDLLLTQFSNPTAGGLGTWNFLRGTINGGTLTTSNGAILHATNDGNSPADTLNGVTLDTGSTLQIDGGNTVAVTNTFGAPSSLTVNGTVSLTAGGVLGISGTQAIGGSGALFTPDTGFGGGSAAGIVFKQNNSAVTLGPNLTLHGGYFGIYNAQFISGSVLINQGTINADTNSVGFQISPNSFTNAAGGLLEVTNASSSINLTATSWTNQGTITLSAGALTLGGSFSTAGIGTLNRPNGTAGTVTLTGTLNNGGADLLLTQFSNPTAGGLGTWNLLRGTINGGTVTTSGGAILHATNDGNRPAETLNGVTIDVNSTLQIDGGNTVNVTNTAGAAYGLTVNGTVSLTGGGILGINGTQSIGGTGAVYTADSGAGGGSAAGIVYNTNNSTLTVAAGLTLHGGYFGIYNAQFVSGSTLINQGIINADTASAGFAISVNSFTSTVTGNVEVTNSGTNLAMSMSGASWANQGTITVSAGTLTLQGTVAGNALGTWKRTGGTVTLVGTVTGGLTLDDNTGSWNFGAQFNSLATLQGGTFQIAPGSSAKLLCAPSSTENLNGGMTLLSPITLFTNSSVTIRVRGGLTLDTTLNLGDPTVNTSGQLVFTGGNQTLSTDGGGTILMGASNLNYFGPDPGVALTIGPGILIHGQSGGIGSHFSANSSIINQGTILADIPSGTNIEANALTINPTTFQNVGTVRALGGARLDVEPGTSLTNLSGTLVSTAGPNGGTKKVLKATLTGGTWEADASSSVWIYPTDGSGGQGNATVIQIVQNAAKIILGGAGAAFFNDTIISQNPVFDDPFASLATNLGAGSFSVSGRNLTVPAGFVNQGALTIGSGSTFATVPSLLPDDGLLVWYRADGDGSDSSGSVITGLLHNGVTFGTGKFGQAFSFPTSRAAYVTDDSTPLPNLTGAALTLEAWVSPAAGNSGTSYVYDKYTGGTGGYSLALVNGVPTLFLGTTGNLNFTLAAPSALPLNTFSHVAATYDGSTATLYVNGIAVASAALTGNIVSDGNVPRVGNDDGTNPTAGFIGLIDNFALYARARTAAEIAATAAPAGFTQASGLTSVNGLLTVAPGVTISGGTLGGSGSIGTVSVPTNVTNSGIVSPGNSPGQLNIIGNYVQTAAGTLKLEIAGRTAGQTYDQLRVTGTASFNGTVQVKLINGFVPAGGDSFQMVSYTPPAGQFSNQQIDSPGPGRRFNVLYDDQGKFFTLQVQGVPPLDFGYATPQATGTSVARKVAVDGSGNTYVVGYFTGTTDFDPFHSYGDNHDLLTTSATAAGYLAKYDVTGALVWVRALDPGAGLATHANDVTLDASGNVWVTGDFQGTSAYTGGGSLTSAGGSDVFLLKTDGGGNALSLQRVGGTGNDVGQGITVNTTTGDVLVTGSFMGGVDFDPGAGTFTLNSAGSGDAFVLRLNGSGGFQGAARLGGGGGDTGSDVAVDAAGNVWVTGDFSQVTTGLAALTSAGGATDTRTDAFLLKLTPSGTGFTTVFAQQFGALGDDHGAALAIDGSGNVLLTGSFHFSVNFDTRPAKSFTLTSSGDSDIFVLKEDNTGTFVWARVIGGYRADAANDVAVDAAGNVYLTGSFQDRVDFDPLDASYILEAQPGDNAFLSKLDATGSFVWAAQLTDPATAGQTGVSDGYGIAEDATGRVFTVGSFLNTIDFDPGLGVQSRSTPAGQTQGFVSMVKQKAAPTGTILGLPSAAVPEGTTLALGSAVADADSVAFTYAWAVARNGVSFASGTGPDLSALLAQPGTYTVTLVVSDESGNTNTQTATVLVNNAAPVLAAASFGAAAQTANPGPATNDQFGKAMASGNGYLLVGTPLDDTAATDAGAAYLYNASTGALLRTLTDPAASTGDLFGSAVAVVGNNLLIGAPGTSGGGKAYLFDATTGNLLNTFTGPNRAAGDNFGASVGGLGNLLLIGAPGKTTAVGSGVGEAYLYDAVAGSYRLLQTFANPTPEANDQFGAAIAAVGATVVIGAPNDNQAGPAAGAAYVFDPQTGNLLTTLLNPNPTATAAQFGGALAASGTRVLVGAPTDGVAGAGAGGVYLFNADPTSATFGALLKAIHIGSGGFGRSLAVSGNRALVGADTDGTGVANSGTAYLIDIDPGSSTYGTSLATFKKASPVANDKFGGAVAFGGDDIVVGAPLDDAGATDSGATYRFAATAFVKASASTINENDSVTLSGAFSDPGSEAHLVRLDWQDGSTPTVLTLGAGTYTFSATHQYLDNPVTGVPSGAYPVSIKIMDQTPDLLVLDNGVNGIGSTRAATTVLRYDGSTGAYEGALVSGAGLTNITGMAVGPDGNVYLANDQGPGNATAVVRYDGQTGAALGTFVTTAAGITGDPTGVVNDLTFGPDGNLYVLSLNGSVAPVLRFNGLTGAALPAPGQTGATFVAAAGSGITGTPSGFTFGPDGNLYVADGSTVLRYSGTTGLPLPAPGQSGAVFVPSDSTLTSGDLAFGPDGSLYVFNRQIGQMYRYDPASGTLTGVYSDVTGSTAAHDFFGADGHFYRADNGGHVLQADGATGQTLGEFVSSGALLNGGLHSSGFLANLDPERGTTFNVTVNNVAPTAVIHAAAGSTATQINLTSTVTDPGTLDTQTYSWSVTNGTPIGPTNTPSFSFAPGTGTITVTLTVTDKDTGSTTVKTQVIVGTAGNDSITVTDPASGTGRVVVFALAGDDRVDASGVTAVPVELVGGAGNDTLIGGPFDDVLYGNEANNYAAGVTDDHGADSLVGGSGNDTLDGGLGNDTMVGGVGNDYYIEVPGSADLLVESGDAFGIDSIDLSQATYGITLSLAQSNGTPQLVNAGQTSTVALQGQFENLFGSAFGDVLTGSASANAISGGAGNDVIFGGNPLDTLNGGQGSTSLPGAQGNDTLVGGTGNDTIYGGWGNDVIFGDYVPSTLPGGSGISSLPGAQGNDSVPGSYDDTIIGGRGDDTIYGGAGNDVIFGGDTQTTLVGSGGGQPGTDNNSIIGGGGNDTIYGGAGNDVIFGGDTQTTLSGGSGGGASSGNDNNSIIGGGGNDTIYGGAGNDVIFGGDTQTTMVGASSPGNDNNSIIGGGGNDTIYGGAGNDVIFGGDTQNTLVSSSSPGNDNNSIIGGGGNDTIYGGAGNDVIFGGDTQTTLSGGSGNSTPSGNDNNSIIGGAGNDTIYGGAGNDVIFGGDTLTTMAGGSSPSNDDDSIIGAGGNDTIYGGPGNDVIFGGDTQATLSGGSGNSTSSGGQDNNSILGGGGNDTIYGGAGNDVIFGGDTLDSLPGATGGGDDSLLGGPGNDTIYGGAGNDVIFGGDGNDVLSGGPGTNIVEGEGGYDVVTESADANMVLTPTKITVGSNPAELLYDVEAANLTGGNSGDSLDASAFPGSVTLVGGTGNDTLLGGAAADYLVGGAGDDSLVAGAGDDTLDGGAGNDFVSGGDGNDTYLEIPGGSDVLTDSSGIDSVDFSQAPYGISLDMNVTAPQVVDSAGNTVTLNGTFENVIGTSYADKITGNSAPNIIDGAGGNDTLDGGAGNDVVQGAVPQVVYLDFNSATGLGEHVYTIDERNAIQAQLEKDFAFPFSFTWSQTAPAVGEYTTLLFNAGDTSEALVGGQADQIDARNEDLSGFAAINVNGLLGHAGQPPATSANFVGLSTTIAAHELGHELGLQHADAYGPLGINPLTGLPYGIYSGLEAKSVSRNEVITNPGGGTALGYLLAHSPVLTGPVQMAGDATATPHPQPSGSIFAGARQVGTFTVNSSGALAVTAAVGQGATVVGGSLNLTSGLLALTWSADPGPNSVVMNYDYDPYRPGYRGPDDAFETPNHIMASPAALGTTLAQATATTYFGERELVKLAFADAGATTHQDPAAPHVPIVVGSTTYSAQNLGTLPALAVPNLLPSGATNYGTVFNVRATSVVGTLATGGQSDFYAFTGKAGDLVNLETYSNALTGRVSDPIDSVLSVYDSSGNLVPYYGTTAVSDDTFESQDSALTDLVLPADGTYYVKVNAFSPADTGSYELFVYTFAATPITQHGGDTLIGGPGSDVLIGSTGDDVFVGSLGEDIFLGYTPADSTTITLDHAPVASDGSASVAHRSSGVDIPLAATDADNDPLTYSIVNGPLHGTLTLNGATAHYVPAGNFVGSDTFSWKANDGTLDSNIATVTIMVTNSAPTVTVALNNSAPLTNDTLTATATSLDADGDPVTLTYVWKVNGSVVKTTAGTTATSDTLDLSTAGNGNRGDTVSVEVTPNDGFTGGTTASASAVVADSAPTANPQSVALFEDTSAPVTLSGSDPDNDALSFIIVSGPSHGTLTGGGATLTYTPAANYNGPDSFTYKANDGSLDSAPVAVTITVNSVNDAPVFTKGADQSVLEDAGPQSVTGWATNIAAGPPDEAGQMLTFLVSTDNPSLFATRPSIDPATGTLTYTSAVDANGTATVTVRLMDNGGTANGGSDTSAPQTFVITVIAVNDPPIANDDYVTTNEDTPVTIPVLANDRPGPITAVDEYSQTLTVTQLNGVAVTAGSSVRTAHGSALLNADGTVTYTPDPDYNGPDGFGYTVQDNGVPPQSATAHGYVTINPVNDAPVLNSTSAAFPAVNEDNTNNAGTPVSTFVASLNITDVDAGAVGGLAVTGVDEAHGDWQFSTDGGTTWTSFGAVSDGAARLLADSTSDRIRFAPNLYFRGQATFSFRAWDQTSGSDGGTADTTANGGITAFSTAVGSATITINPVNHAPVAVADSYATNEDTLLAPAPAGVLTNDTDIDHDPLQAVLVDGPQHAAPGGFALSPDGSFRYLPAANYNGSDSFSYKAFDGQAYSNVVTVSLTINPVDDAPVAQDGTLATNEDTAASGSLAATDVDNPASDLTYAVVTGPAHGSLSLDKATGQYTYTPAANYNGPDTFTWKANDGQLDSNVAAVSISVAPVNDPPVGYAQSVATDEDTPLQVQLTGDDGDPEVVQVLTFAVVSGPSHGRLTSFDPATGKATYAPDPDYNGPDGFTFSVTDDASAGPPAALSATATVTITVNSVNDPPVAQDDAGATYEDTALTGASVLANDSDYHNGAPGENNVPLTAVLVSGPAHAASFTLNADGTYSYTPSLYYHGGDSFTYQARDSLGALSNTATVSLTIYAVNHPPVANPDAATTDEDHAASGNVLANDTDVDGDPLSVVAVNGQPAAVGQTVTLGSGARLTVHADGSYTYDPRGAFDALAAGATATDGFTYAVADGQGGMATGSVTVTVTGVDDAPVAQDGTASVGHRSTAGVDIPLAASDVDTAGLTYQVVTAPAHGTVTLSGGTAHYVPAGNYVGTDSFTWKANDGTLDSNTATVTITLTNSAPSVAVALSSSAPLTNDTLTVTATPLDADGDPVTLTYVWKVNGSVVKTTAGTTAASDTLDLSAAGNGDRGDTVSVEVTPNDGFTGGAAAMAAATVADSAPVIDSVSIDQGSPRTGDTLSVTVNSHDADGDSISYAYQWYRNGTAISGATGSTLDLSAADSGDRGDGITVTVMANDGTLSGAAATSAAVTVQDTAPVITAVSIAPGSPSVSDTLTANVSSSDADGDPVSYAYQWYRNGAAIPGATQATLIVSGNAAHGDGITVTVTPSDGTLSGAAVTSAAVTVRDTAPAITAVSITPSSPSIGDTVTANVTSSDADGDTVSYSYQWYKNGIAIPGATGQTLAVSGNAAHGDAIAVSVTPSDGTLSGAAFDSVGVIVQDTAPVVSAVSITPSSPSVKDTLTANVTSSDADGDSITYAYQWYRNGTAISGATQATLVVSGNAAHGDSITVAVKPNDGSLSGAAATSAAVTIQDTAPVISSVTIAPSSPSISDTLAASASSSDADGDTVTYAYQWYKNGTAIAGATQATLVVSGNAAHGDSITVAVTPSDGTLSGAAVTSAAATVQDTAPVVDSVTIAPSSPTIASVLTANVTSHDADADTVSYSYQWYKNGAAIPGATGQTLTVSGSAAHGDSITVKVTPSDGTLSGTALTSGAVTVQDTAPVITAVSIAPASPTTNQILTAAVTAHDADNDSISFAYQWYKNGTAISGATASSLDLSRTGYGDRGDAITVSVTPSDGTLSGAAVTSASVTVADSAPVIDSVSISPTSPTASSTLTANVASHDADGDTVTYAYQWYKNGSAISGATGSTLNLAQTANAATGDAITVAVTPSDGTLSGTALTSAAVTVTSSGATATTTTLTSSVASAIPGQSIAFTAAVAPKQGTGTPTGNVDFLDTTTGIDLGTVSLSAGQAVLSTSALTLGSHTIQASYGGDAQFLPSSTTLTQVVTRSVYVLSAGAAAAVSLSGNANVTIPGNLVIDSNSGTALSESGNAHLTAGAIQVVGGVQKSGNATVSPAPVTGSAAAADPLGSLTVPSVGGSPTPVSVSGNTSLTISPGVYSQISVSGNGRLTLKPGVYVIAGGGLTLSGNALVSGTGVLIYNAGSKYTANGGTGGTFGAISVSGNAQLNISAATSGAYAGIALFQSRDNTQTISLAGNAVVGLSSGVLYAPAATLSIGGSAQLPRAPLVVSQLQVSGNGASANAHVGGGGTGPNADANTSNGLAFTTAPQMLAGGAVSRSITVQLVDADGNAVTAGSGGVTLTLGSTSAYGTFLDTDGNPLAQPTVTIPEGASTASFRYADSTVGFPTLTVSGSGVSATQQQAVNPGSSVYSPAAVRAAYGVNNLGWDGTGQTIAIVDAYDDPAIFQSLDAFDSLFGRATSGPTLYQEYGPASSFLTVLNQDGGTALPAADPAGAGAVNWEVETALDVEWAHALAPGAQIILVEANSQSLPDLMTAVASAAAQPGVSVVSMSWGFVEGQDVLAQDEAQYDSYLTTPAGHQGVTFVASTGDYGAGVPQFPAFSPNVVAVGGTALTVAGGTGDYAGESAWGYYDNDLGTYVGGGGGLSQYEAEPAFQKGMQSTGQRTTPDVSFVADPATGAWVADTYNLDGANPWEIAGGTSLSAPAWAGLLALANQGRADAGLASLGSGGSTETQAALYGLNAADYHDVASGSNGYAAGAGYDLATGLGTPVADQLVADLAAYSGSGSSTPVGPITAAGLVLSDKVGSVKGTTEALARAAALRVFSVEGVVTRVTAPSGQAHGGQATRAAAAGGVPAALDTASGGTGAVTTNLGGRPASVLTQPADRQVMAGSADIVRSLGTATGPQIDSFTASAYGVAAGSSVTLTASNVTDAGPGSAVARVAFYVRANGSTTLLGDGTQTSPGAWSLRFTVMLASGSYTLFAEAQNDLGVLGDPAVLMLTVF
jgi:VCBS repeat-containing protein